MLPTACPACMVTLHSQLIVMADRRQSLSARATYDGKQFSANRTAGTLRGLLDAAGRQPHVLAALAQRVGLAVYELWRVEDLHTSSRPTVRQGQAYRNRDCWDTDPSQQQGEQDLIL